MCGHQLLVRVKAEDMAGWVICWSESHHVALSATNTVLLFFLLFFPGLCCLKLHKSTCCKVRLMHELKKKKKMGRESKLKATQTDCVCCWFSPGKRDQNPQLRKNNVADRHVASDTCKLLLVGEKKKWRAITSHLVKHRWIFLCSMKTQFLCLSMNAPAPAVLCRRATRLSSHLHRWRAAVAIQVTAADQFSSRVILGFETGFFKTGTGIYPT